MKKLEGETKDSTRHIRCLLVNVDGKKYLIDVDEQVLREFDEEEFEEKDAKFIRFKDLPQDRERYNGM